jgi:hypothetical protein
VVLVAWMLIGTGRGKIQLLTGACIAALPLIQRRRASAVSKDGGKLPWFETREDTLLTMRGQWRATP